MTNSATRFIENARYIDSDRDLQIAVSEIVESPVLAIDTEFVRERTYIPNLCLIQLATASSGLWCIDPMTIDDLSPLMSIINDSAVVKILHAARQDIEIFHLQSGVVPSPIFDTQIAAAFSGHADQIAYGTLVEDLFGVALDKSSSRTDWARRPLSERQLQYALNDVVYLDPIRLQLSDTLSDKNRFEWFQEECGALSEPALYEVLPRDAWRRIKGAARLSDTEFINLVALAAWRESVAKQQNLPRSWVIKDQDLMRLAEIRRPTIDDLQTRTELSPKQCRKWGDAIVAALANSDTYADETKPADLEPINGAQKALLKKVSSTIKRRAEELEISAPILANRRDMEKAVRGFEDISLFSGWRQIAIGEEVRNLLRAEMA